jgi:hypothetical protein
VNFAKEEDPEECDLNNNPFTMPTTNSVGPNSFVDIRQPYDHASPPPRYFTEDILLSKLPQRKEEILKGLIEPQFGGLVCTD